MQKLVICSDEVSIPIHVLSHATAVRGCVPVQAIHLDKTPILCTALLHDDRHIRSGIDEAMLRMDNKSCWLYTDSRTWVQSLKVPQIGLCYLLISVQAMLCRHRFEVLFGSLFGHISVRRVICPETPQG